MRDPEVSLSGVSVRADPVADEIRHLVVSDGKGAIARLRVQGVDPVEHNDPIDDLVDVHIRLRG